MSASDNIIDAALPASLDAERAVLGAMLLDASAIDTVAQMLKPAHFHHAIHQQLFKVIIELHGRHVAIDVTTVVDEMQRLGQLEKAGGPAYINALDQNVFATTNAEHYARIVVEKYQLRELVRITQEIQQKAYHQAEGVDAILDNAGKLIYDLSEQRSARDFVEVGNLVIGAVDEIDVRSKSTHDVTGVATGFTDLDTYTGGLQTSDLIILAARPSVGKTAFALNLSLNVGAGLRNRQVDAALQRPVGVFSLEMGANQITQRLLATLAEVPMHLMRTGRLNTTYRERIHRAAKQLGGSQIHVDDTPNISVLELRSKARRLKTKVPELSLLVIDYLQLMHSGGRVESRQQEVSEITRSLKALARELELPIIALSQLSRLIEHRKGKNARPMLSDLRESGAIEQDADIVMFIHREKITERREDEEEGGAAARAQAQTSELVIGKHRNGPIGIIDMVFFPEIATFRTLAKQYSDDEVGF
jgi:replicative DNA helicase